MPFFDVSSSAKATTRATDCTLRIFSYHITFLGSSFRRFKRQEVGRSITRLDSIGHATSFLGETPRPDGDLVGFNAAEFVT